MESNQPQDSHPRIDDLCLSFLVVSPAQESTTRPVWLASTRLHSTASYDKRTHSRSIGEARSKVGMNCISYYEIKPTNSNRKTIEGGLRLQSAPICTIMHFYVKNKIKFIQNKYFFALSGKGFFYNILIECLFFCNEV